MTPGSKIGKPYVTNTSVDGNVSWVTETDEHYIWLDKSNKSTAVKLPFELDAGCLKNSIRKLKKTRRHYTSNFLWNGRTSISKIIHV